MVSDFTLARKSFKVPPGETSEYHEHKTHIQNADISVFDGKNSIQIGQEITQKMCFI